MHGLLMCTMIFGQKWRTVQKRAMEQQLALPHQEIFRETEIEVVLDNGVSVLELEIVSKGS